ncbi:Motile Sperm domain containing protein [Trichuris trichiura]|uniref:Major sperm protein n=1 Tax=Trichuris trichiura TaxID=36087 RepID=A0A077ZK83_TRITR|nr:Motile Sperm domain containing protein [Trichuris trichiura]
MYCPAINSAIWIEQVKILEQLQVSPSVVHIHPCDYEARTAELIIKNPTLKLVTFKTRSTISRYLTTKPIYGIIFPQQHIRVAVKLRKVDAHFRIRDDDELCVYFSLIPTGKERYNPRLLWLSYIGVRIRKTVCLEYGDYIDSKIRKPMEWEIQKRKLEEMGESGSTTTDMSI